MALLLAAASPLAAGRRYSGQGLVLAVDAAAPALTVSHDRIPGYMEPMVMTWKVSRSELVAGLTPGSRIYFRLAVSPSGSVLDHIRILSADPVDPARWQDPVVSRVVRVGEPVPNFRLVDQAGRRLALSDLRGQTVVITFLYTRCPLPDYCPRMNANFNALRRRFPARLGRDLTLLSVSFDPEHDTPEVLARFARALGGAVGGWHFLTGPREEIMRLAGSLGVEYWPDQGLFTHNLRTSVVDGSGRLAAAVDGSSYDAARLGDLVERLLPGR